VALKGGKGPWADTAPENGINERIIVEDCEYGFCHGCLTFGSENVHSRNIIMQNIRYEVEKGILTLVIEWQDFCSYKPDLNNLKFKVCILVPGDK
jgi:hypothetical protein